MDEHIGIDYSLLRDPAVSTDTLDLDFKVILPYCSPPWEQLCQPARWAPQSEQGGLRYGCRNIFCSCPRACSSPVEERTRSWRIMQWSQ